MEFLSTWIWIYRFVLNNGESIIIETHKTCKDIISKYQPAHVFLVGQIKNKKNYYIPCCETVLYNKE